MCDSNARLFAQQQWRLQFKPKQWHWLWREIEKQYGKEKKKRVSLTTALVRESNTISKGKKGGAGAQVLLALPVATLVVSWY